MKKRKVLRYAFYVAAAAWCLADMRKTKKNIELRVKQKDLVSALKGSGK